MVSNHAHHRVVFVMSNATTAKIYELCAWILHVNLFVPFHLLDDVYHHRPPAEPKSLYHGHGLSHLVDTQDSSASTYTYKYS